MWVKILVQFYRTTAPIMSRSPDPAKARIREQVAASIATLSADEKKRQSEIVYNKLLCEVPNLGLLMIQRIVFLIRNLPREDSFVAIISNPHYKAANRIAIFMSTDDEVNTGPIISHIKSKGAAAFVPQYAGGKMRMLKLETGDEDNMPLTRHGIAQHSKDQKREDALDEGLDLIIAPGVAFTKNGGRVGHGGGYYDKYIANLRTNPATAPKVIAIGFKCQVLDEVPMNDQDQRIDGVIFAED